MSGQIAPIAGADVRRIAGAQVVPDMRAAVKELVENALDAKASSIGQRHHTSKLTTFDDLAFVGTFGFRGEALASLCTVANVTVITATAEEAPMGTVLEFDHEGRLTSSDKRQARQRGTTVIVSNLLANLPVRRRELQKHIKREYNKAFSILQTYALIAQDVRWSATVQQENGKQVSQLLMRSASGHHHIQSNVSALFGTKTSATVQPFEFDIFLADTPAHLYGVISQPAPGQGRSSGDRQYFYLNGRPWDNPKLAQVFNQVYKSFNMTQYPLVVANLVVSTNKYDVNVSPDKRTLFMHDEAELLERVREALETFFSHDAGVFPTNEVTSRKRDLSDLNDVVKVPRTIQDTVSTKRASWAQSENDAPETGDAVDHDAGDSVVASHTESSMQAQFRRAVANFARKQERTRQADVADDDSHSSADNGEAIHMHHDEVDVMEQQFDEPLYNADTRAEEHESEESCLEAPSLEMSTTGPEGTDTSDSELVQTPVHNSQDEISEDVLVPDDDEEDAENMDAQHIREEQEEDDDEFYADYGGSDAAEHARVLQHEESGAQAMLTFDGPRPPNRFGTESSLQASSSRAESVSFSLENVEHRRVVPLVHGPEPSDAINGADVGEPDEVAVAAMERVIRKADFRAMCVCGQFNLGFIIARRTTPTMDDLFIIDQHAADEKHNFEDLEKNTCLFSQRLVLPQRLELAPMDELVAREHREWLRMNGFDTLVDESAPPGSRIQLLSKPVSKSVVFDVQDFEELLFLLRDVPAGTPCRARCSRVYDMLASRACRKSIMVGSALSMREMRAVVHNMAETDKPWNCPHGRPTMRHLSTLPAPHSPRPVVWSALALL